MVSTVILGRRAVANIPIFFSSIPTFLPSKQWSTSSSRLGYLRNIYSTTLGIGRKNHVHMDETSRVEFEVGVYHKPLISFETIGTSYNKITGGFANGAVVMTMGETKVLATVNAASSLMNGDHARRDHACTSGVLNVDYNDHQFFEHHFSTQDYQLQMHRDGALIIDRAIRPLFPAGFLQDIQVMVRVLTSDGKHDPVAMAANAASAALMLSDIPWGGPIGVVHVGRVAGGEPENLFVNPRFMGQDEVDSDLNLIYACTKDKTLKIDFHAAYDYSYFEDDELKSTLLFAHREAVKYLEPQIRLAAKAGRQKKKASDYKLSMLTDRALEKVNCLAEAPVKAVFSSEYRTWSERYEELNKIKQNVKRVLKAEGDQESLNMVGKAVDTVMKNVVRTRIIEEGIRVDGRALNEVRPLHCDNILLDCNELLEEHHGSSRFSLGDATAECIVTHDQFSSTFLDKDISINVGSGNRNTFAENALISVISGNFPDFRVIVTSKLDDNKYNCKYHDGSSSTSCIATLCGASLALRGEYVVEDVAGVSMGLVSEVDPITGIIKDYRILTDICGLEECEELGLGDMDLRIAGTKDKVTSIQLTILSKINGIPLNIICECLEPALQARHQILDRMKHALSRTNSDAESTP